MPLTNNRLPAIRAGLAAAADRGVQTTAEAIKATRDPLTPVDTGELLRSGAVVQVTEGHWQVREGDGLPDARASYTEMGTDKQAAQPHFYPAIEQHREDLPKNIAAEIAKLTGG